MKSKDKIVLITGASSGFGKGLGEELHRLGYLVYGTSRNPEKHNSIFNLIEADVQEESSVKTAVKEVIDKEGRIDILINNAGVLTIGPLEETSIEEAHDIFETNFFGVLRMTQAVLPTMREKNSGRIINISSLAGQVPTPGMGMYCASKHALEGYSKTLRLELESLGIDVTLVEPGEYKTAVLNNATYAIQKIKDYDKIRKSTTTAIVSAEDNARHSSEIVDLLVQVVTAKKTKVHYRKGDYASTIPIMQLFPALLNKVVRKAYKL